MRTYDFLNVYYTFHIDWSSKNARLVQRVMTFYYSLEKICLITSNSFICWQVRSSDDKVIFEKRKKYIQDRFRTETGLLIDVVLQGIYFRL